MPAVAIISLVGVTVTFLSTIIGCAWYLGHKAGNIETKMDLLMTNHLPHIDARLERLENVIIEGHARTN